MYHQALLRGRWRSRRRSARRAGLGEARFVISQDSHIDFVLFVVVFLFQQETSLVNRHSLRQPVVGCGGARSRTLQVRMYCFNFMSSPPRLSQGLFFCMHVNRFFFLTLGIRTVLLSSSTCDSLLFQDCVTTYSARGLAAVFTETGVHGVL